MPEIHDVYRGMAPELEAMLSLLPKQHETKFCFNIVPNWQGNNELWQDHQLIDRLGSLTGLKILHGWTHSLGPGPMNWLLYGHDNRSEFGKLNKQENFERIRKGVLAFEKCFGDSPKWFCAPRWQQNRFTSDELYTRGFEGFMLRDQIITYKDGNVPLSAINFDEGERRVVIAIAEKFRNRAIRYHLSSGVPFRLALHPADLSNEKIRNQIDGFVQQLIGDGWKVLSIEQALNRWNANNESVRHAPV
ncbi:MAG: DUF2334 domain-containing protein [Pseudomonadota bacterium]